MWVSELSFFTTPYITAELYDLSLPGIVQHKVVVWLYFALELSVPAVLYSALSYDGSLVSMLVSHDDMFVPICSYIVPYGLVFPFILR